MIVEARSAEHEQTKVAKRICERVIRREATETKELVYKNMFVCPERSEETLVTLAKSFPLQQVEISGRISSLEFPVFERG